MGLREGLPWRSPERVAAEQNAAAERGDWDAVLRSLQRQDAEEALEARRSRVAVGAAVKRIAKEDSPTRDARRRAVLEPIGARVQRQGSDEMVAALEALAQASGYTLAERVAPFPRGKPSAEIRARYDALAVVVSVARSRGAGLNAIGKVIGRPKQRVAELANRGAELKPDSSACK
jgi:hypothetical protein